MTEKDTRLNQKPLVNISRSTTARMWLVCFCAVLAVIQSALGDSGASLIIAGSALCSAILAELLITYKTCGFEKLKDGSAAASALIFSLLLPNQIHPVYAVLGALFAMVVVKYSFGGLGSNWLNPGLGGWLFVRFSWPAVFMTALRGSPLRIIEDALRSGYASDAPVRFLRLNETIGTSIDGSVSTFLNNTFFSFFKAELPAGYIDLLISRSPGIIADRGMLALLAGTILIIAFRISRGLVSLVYLGVFGVLVLIFGDLPFAGLLWNGDLLFALFSGGTMAAAFILVSDPVTGAKSYAGAVIMAVFGGFLTWIFRYCGFEIYGAFFAVALANTLTPAMRLIEGRCLYSPKLKVWGETQ